MKCILFYFINFFLHCLCGMIIFSSRFYINLLIYFINWKNKRCKLKCSQIITLLGSMATILTNSNYSVLRVKLIFIVKIPYLYVMKSNKRIDNLISRKILQSELHFKYFLYLFNIL